MPIVQSDIMSPREKILLDADKDENERNRQFQLKLKQTELESKKQELKLRQQDRIRYERHTQRMAILESDIRRHEASWTNIMRLPVTVVKLPVYIIFALAYCIGTITKQEFPADYWKNMK